MAFKNPKGNSQSCAIQMRYIQIFLVGFFLLFPLVTNAEDGLVTTIYKSFKTGADEDATTRVSAMLGVEPDVIDTFRKTGVIADEDSHLLDVCRLREEGTIAEGSSSQSTDDQNRCLEQVRALWEEEHLYALLEREEFEKANAFGRYWDGEKSGKGDIDFQADLHTTDRQVQGKDASPTNAPTPNADIRKRNSLTETSYRLPAEGLSFSTSGGCGEGETSYFGGILCLPSFCSDFVCVKVNAVSGSRSASTSGTQESSIKNLANAGYDTTNTLHDTQQKTPTQNSNQAHFPEQIFNWLQTIGKNFEMKPKTPPLLEGLTQPDGTETTRKTTRYVVSEDGKPGKVSSSLPSKSSPKGTDGVKEEMKALIQKEFQRVRSEDFGLCHQGSAECKSIDLLQSLMEECDAYANQSTSGPASDTVLKCIRDSKEHAMKTNEEAEFANVQRIRQEFYDDAPEQLDMLWGEIIALNKQLKSINLCTLQQSKFRCGMKKRDCSIENGL